MKAVILVLIVETLAVALHEVVVAQEEPVDFADPLLKHHVEGALGFLDPTPSDMLLLISLRASRNDPGAGIRKLDGLEFAANLEHLALACHSTISDVSVLSALTKLRFLNLSETEVSDIAPLATLPLESLNLCQTRVRDVSPLSEVRSLRSLWLSGPSPEALSVVWGLEGLVSLHLDRLFQRDASTLSGISRLSNLRDLFLSGGLTDVSYLSGLTGLERLHLMENSIRDVSPLLGLTNLLFLDLEENPLSCLSRCAVLPAIKAKIPDIEINDCACEERCECEAFQRGDVDLDGNVNLSDPVVLLGHLFGGGARVRCEKSADADDSGKVGISDAVFLLNALFTGGPTPPWPFPSCGADLTPDELTCAAAAEGTSIGACMSVTLHGAD